MSSHCRLGSALEQCKLVLLPNVSDINWSRGEGIVRTRYRQPDTLIRQRLEPHAPQVHIVLQSVLQRSLQAAARTVWERVGVTGWGGW